MLLKNTDVIINRANIFENDCLDRKQIVVDLTNLIQSTKQPFVLSIEAPWGWGKTTFIRFWKCYLESENHPCLYFNAWSNDFAEDPLIAFLSEMTNLLQTEQDEGKGQALKTALRKAQRIGGGILRRGLPVPIKVVTHGIINEQLLDGLKGTGDEFGTLLEKVAQERIDAYEQEKEGMGAFRDSLSEFAKKISESNGRRGPVVFFIDELDRCRPDYAIALLERIKHLFNVEGVIFVLSIDRNQLENSIQAIYGQSMNTDGYIRRFIDLCYRLPNPTTDNFCKMLFNKFKIHEVFEQRYKDARYRHDREEETRLINVFTNLAIVFPISLRIQEQCLIEINIILRTTGDNYFIFPELLSFLVVIKSCFPEIYTMMQNPIPDIDLLMKKVREILVGSQFIEHNLEPYIAANILSNFTNSPNRAPVLQTLESLSNNSDDYEETEVRRAQKILRILKGISDEFHDRSKGITRTISRINSIGNFLQ